MYHHPDTTEAASATGHKSTGPVGLLPIAPDHGRRQLKKILYAHPEISLELLFHMIMTVGKRISSGTDPSTAAKKRTYVVGLDYSNQCVGAEEVRNGFYSEPIKGFLFLHGILIILTLPRT